VRPALDVLHRRAVDALLEDDHTRQGDDVQKAVRGACQQALLQALPLRGQLVLQRLIVMMGLGLLLRRRPRRVAVLGQGALGGEGLRGAVDVQRALQVPGAAGVGWRAEGGPAERGDAARERGASQVLVVRLVDLSRLQRGDGDLGAVADRSAAPAGAGSAREARRGPGGWAIWCCAGAAWITSRGGALRAPRRGPPSCCRSAAEPAAG
jgi:hypothetical protein